MRMMKSEVATRFSKNIKINQTAKCFHLNENGKISILFLILFHTLSSRYSF
jgi:hypothetical protein